MNELAEPYTRAAMVSVPAELVEALRKCVRNLSPHEDAKRHVIDAARALVDAAERPTAGEGEAKHPKFEAFKAERLQDPEVKAAYDEARERNAPVGEPSGDTNDLCSCGHFMGWHHAEGGGVFGMCLWPNGWPDKRECKCNAYENTPAPLSPSVRRTRDEGSALTDEEKAKLTHAMNAGSLGPAVESIIAARLEGKDDRG